MAKLGLNFTYVADPSSFAYDVDRNPTDITRVMTVLMITTGINRLFTPEDFEEFFTRLAISFKHYGLIESFFTDDSLFEFTSVGVLCIAKVDDIIPFIGVTFGDPRENTGFNHWLEKFDNIQFSSLWMSAKFKLGLFHKEIQDSGSELDEREVNFDIEPIKLDITDTDILNAKIMSKTILKEIPTKLFNDWKQRFPDAEEAIRKEVERKRTCLFDFEKLAPEVKRKIREHFSYYWDKEDYDEDLAIKLTHLAYLWANGFVFYVDYDGELRAEIDDFFPLNLEDFELEGGGYNLEETKDNFDLDSLFPLLKITNAEN